MNFKRAITPSITIGDQPTEADLAVLKQEGFTGVVNLRNEGEPDQPISALDEGNKVRAMGLDYLHSGVGALPLTMQQVIAISNFVDKHSEGPQKVLVHCRRGPRAAALVLLQQARAQHWDSEEVFAKGKEIGLDVDGGLRSLVERFLQDTTV